MPEVLTETERIVKSKCGRFTAPLRCLLCDFTTQASHDAGLDYEQQEQVWSDHSDSTHPLVRVDPERARLEREVINRAKEFTDDKEPRDNWDALVAYRELCRAVDALIDFESSQQQIKK